MSSDNLLNKLKISVSNISLPWLILTLLVFVGLLMLGNWQLNRAIEKEQRLAKMVQIQQQYALSIPQILTLQQKQTDQSYINDFPVAITGEFLSNIIFLLDNQTNAGSLGYRVYQVLQSDDYSVLVNLGWVQGSINRAEYPELQSVSGKVKVKGNIRLIEKGMTLMSQNYEDVSWPFRVQQIELDKFSSLIGHQLLPFVVYLDKNELLGYEKNWQPIVMPPEKHRGYAFQWFSLAIAWLLLMVWACYKFSKNSGR